MKGAQVCLSTRPATCTSLFPLRHLPFVHSLSFFFLFWVLLCHVDGMGTVIPLLHKKLSIFSCPNQPLLPVIHDSLHMQWPCHYLPRGIPFLSFTPCSCHLCWERSLILARPLKGLDRPFQCDLPLCSPFCVVRQAVLSTTPCWTPSMKTWSISKTITMRSRTPRLKSLPCTHPRAPMPPQLTRSY